MCIPQSTRRGRGGIFYPSSGNLIRPRTLWPRRRDRLVSVMGNYMWVKNELCRDRTTNAEGPQKRQKRTHCFCALWPTKARSEFSLSELIEDPARKSNVGI